MKIEIDRSSKAVDDLEHAINEINAIAELYDRLADEDNGLHFLADRIHEVYDKALDAFSRIFRLGDYRDEHSELRKSVEGLVDTVHRFVDGGAQVTEADRQAKIESIIALVQRGTKEGGAANE